MYRTVLNGFALKSVMKAPNIPDYHLMVGSAEEHSSLPLLVSKTSNIPREISENMAEVSKLTNEELAQKIANNELEVNDVNGVIASLGISGV